MRNDRCRWVRHRLPLMAGGDLGVQDRRRVERHLIGCPDCRSLRDESDGALSALRAAARVSPAKADAPSLWPALARQIRESRHVAPRRSFRDLAWPRLTPGLWPAMGLAMGLGGAVAVAIDRGREAPRAASITPGASQKVVATKPEAPASTPLPENPSTPASAAKEAGADPFASPSTFRVGYDLDHGTPVESVNRDTQRSY